MKRFLLAGFVAVIVVTAGALISDRAKAAGPVASGGTFAIDQFYDVLAPYGDWVSHPRHGYVWYPRSVSPEWRPFTVGNWVYTDEYGWYWDSQEPYAWAVYHYGRWGYDPQYSWYWVPGDTWAPAWVQWRYSDDYVGWAPETPVVPASYGGYDTYGTNDPYGGYDSYGGYEPSYGDESYGAYERYAPVPYEPPREAWTFVEPRYLASPAVQTYAVPRNSISIVFSSTKHVYRPEYRHGYVYNAGMPRAHWSRVTNRHIKPHRIHRRAHWDRPNRSGQRGKNARH